MKLTTIVVSLALTSSPAFADISVGVGYSFFTKAGNGTWYQNEYDHQLNMQSPSVTIRNDFKLFSQDMSVGYMYEGKVSSYALAKASDNAYYAHSAYPMSHWYGSGDTQGFFLSNRQHYKDWYVSLGLMMYRSTWEVTIPDWYGCTDAKCLIPTTTPLSIKAVHRAIWKTMPMLNIGYNFDKKTSVEFGIYPADCSGDEFPAVYRTGLFNITVMKGF